jgi:hypothetical protein
LPYLGLRVERLKIKKGEGGRVDEQKGGKKV